MAAAATAAAFRVGGAENESPASSGGRLCPAWCFHAELSAAAAAAAAA